MIRFYTLLLFLFISQSLYAQKFIAESGNIKFFSEELLEDITAVNNKVKSVFDIETGQIVFSVNIKGFEFDKSLMQEHFNEKYLESDLYPKSTFNGHLSGYKASQRNNTDVTAEGVLEIHGVKQPLKVSGSLDIEKNNVTLHAVFMIKLEDYKIKVPELMFQKIAEEIEITIDIEYEPYKK